MCLKTTSDADVGVVGSRPPRRPLECFSSAPNSSCPRMGQTPTRYLASGSTREVAVSPTSLARIRAAVLIGAPALLLLGFAYHPYIANATGDAAIASTAADDTTRSGLAHLAIGVGYGLMALAFVALRSYLREAGEERWSSLGLPFAVLGSCLLIPLTGMELRSSPRPKRAATSRPCRRS